MRYLVLANTPAHVHTYKHAVDRLETAGHDVLVLARDYACTVDVLAYHDITYEVYGSHATDRYSTLRFARELPGHFARVLRRTLSFGPDVVFGRGPYAAFAGTVGRASTVLLLDSVPRETAYEFSARFADVVLTPESFRGSFGANHYTFQGFKESAYLHPATFERDPSVREELNVGRDEPYAILRFNAFDAYHDLDQDGLTAGDQRELVERLSEDVRVFVSDEGGRSDYDVEGAEPFDLHPARMHDALAEASLLVAETGTMVTEAAMLGTPVVGAGAFHTWDFGEFDRLKDAGLVSVAPTVEETVERSRALLDDPDAAARWSRRRDEFVSDTVDLTALLVDVATSPDRVSIHAALTPRGEVPETPSPR
jgi:predicted glycosyltransferase